MRFRFVSNATLRFIATTTNIHADASFSLLRAIHEGSISLLKDAIKKPLLEAYREMGAANTALDGKFARGTPEASNDAQFRIAYASPKIQAAREELLKFLTGNNGL